MSTAIKKVDQIRQIVRLKLVMMRWKHTSLRRRSVLSYSDFESPESDSIRRIPPGFLAVYVGTERKRFLIPARFLNLPVFVGLLKKAEEEFGFSCNGGLVLPCEVTFFREIIRLLDKDENKYGKFCLEEFFKMVFEVGFDSCKQKTGIACQVFTPLLQRANV